jgi:hypothetical protein
MFANYSYSCIIGNNQCKRVFGGRMKLYIEGGAMNLIDKVLLVAWLIFIATIIYYYGDII